jgi:diguanylate cyclase (GGDEF)-like protein/hemerythrin-like metal-binding protein
MSDMEIFPWNAYFQVGVVESDDQHKKLVSIINEICSCVLSATNYVETIERLFLELIDYTKYHFENEEQYYAEHALPEHLLADHKHQHADLVTQIHTLKDKYDSDPDEDNNMEEVLTTLVLWLTKHILVSDMRLCMITANLDAGMAVEKAILDADQNMHGPKGVVAQVMSSMMNVSSASVLELRREISFRKQLETELNQEILMRKDAEEKLKYLAQHDVLTGLPNRRLFEELGSSALSLAKRNKLQQAILFIDIDGFKSVNDQLGHAAGDALLVQISRRLEECVRDSDIVARFGGDEFCIYLGGDCNIAAATVVAEKVVGSLSRSFSLDEGQAQVGASIGISTFPEDAPDIGMLVHNADEAMYAAKKSGKNSFRIFH